MKFNYLTYLTTQGSMSLTIRTFFLAVLKYLEKDSFSGLLDR